jgi:hypothetical protein
MLAQIAKTGMMRIASHGCFDSPFAHAAPDTCATARCPISIFQDYPHCRRMLNGAAPCGVPTVFTLPFS